MKIRILILTALLAVAGASLGWAQGTTGGITGRVADAQGLAVPGVAVTVTGPQGSRTFTTDADGRFAAALLVPGTYTVRAELQGFKAAEAGDVVVLLGQDTNVALQMEVGGIEETVQVMGASSTIDTSSTTTGSVLSSDTLSRIPVGRRVTETLYVAPGVSSSGSAGRANPSFSGSSGLDNLYVVDGVNITNAGYGAIGSYSIVFGSLGTATPYDFVQEVQVKTGGYEAEFGQSMGGVVNVLTKSGTNQFRGSLFGYTQPDALESSWKTVQTPNGTVNTVGRENHDFGAEVGLPIIRDKLFFFGAINPSWETRTFNAPEGFPLKTLGDVDRERTLVSYSAKGTYQLAPTHRIDASFFGDPSTGKNGPQRTSALLGTDTSRFSEIDYGGHNQAIRYDGILSPSWLIEASVARARNTISELPAVDDWRVIDRTVVPNVTTGGIGFYEQGNDGQNLQYALKSTNIFNAGGNHQVRYGVQYEDIEYNNINQRTGSTFALSDGRSTATGAQIDVLSDPTYGRIYRVVRANLNSGRETVQKYLSFFIQDTWQVGSRLTLRPGFRYEQQKLVGSDDPPLCREGESVPGLGDGSGTPMACNYTWDGNWGPRLGATFDIRGDGRSKVFASWGRFYAKVPNDLAARAMSADAGVTRADYFDAALTRPVPDGVLAAGVTEHLQLAGLHASTFAPGSKSTYQDEFLAGIEFAVGRNLNVGVRYIRRTLPRILEDYAQASPVMYELGFPGLASVEYFIDNITPELETLNPTGVPGFENVTQPFFEDPEHTYDSVELTANKSFSDNWSLVGSYRWSRLKGLFEGFYRNDNGQSDPAITSLFDFPTNDPSYAAIGVPQFGFRGDIRYQGCTLGCGTLPNDRTHQIKLYANRTWGSLNLGIGLNAGSGRPLTELAANPTYQNAGEIPLTLRGGGMETVDGRKDRSPAEFAADAHVDYTLKVAGDRRVMLIADVFNLFNTQKATDYDNWSDSGFGSRNPNFGFPTNGGGSRAASFQAPLSLRLGARFEW